MTGQLHDPDAITELAVPDCWALLESQSLGHLGFHLGREVDVVPLNYLAFEGRVVFRTAEGSKLLGMTMDDQVALCVTVLDGESARSAVVHGHVRPVPAREAESADAWPLRPWVPTIKDNLLEIVSERVTGRAFRLVRE